MADAKGDLLERVQRAAKYGPIHVSRVHGRERTNERSARAEDVRTAILSATSAIDQPNKDRPDQGVVRIEGGVDTDGDPLTVVVAETSYGLRIVTVF
jgi:hypothetical protein